MNKRVICFALAICLLIVVVGCGNSGTTDIQGAEENEILTTTPVDQDKTMITVRVEFGAGQQQNLEEVLEEQFPDVDIVLRHDGSTSSNYTMKANLEAGVECDLILSRRLPFAGNIAPEYLLDLSSEDFVDSYYMSAVDSCADSEGKIFYLPGPSDVYGIVYDKTMFAENGWEVPHSYSEFVALLDTIRQTDFGGKTVEPFAVSLMYPDMFQILFNTYSYEEVYSGSDNFLWLSAYQEGEGSMIDHMEPAVEKFKQLFADGVLSLGALELTPSERSQMLYADHTTAMIIECQNAVDYEQNILETASAEGEVEDHEIAMMPFWTSDEEDSDFLYAIPSYYMAINKASADESEEKKELLLDIYRYLSSVEGQEMLIGDDFQVSNIAGVAMNENDFSKEIISTIERGNIINTFYLATGEDNKQVERQMLSTVPELIDGTLSEEDWLSEADDARSGWLVSRLLSDDSSSYGHVETTLTRLETAYTVAEMYKDLTGADIGICRGGGWSHSTNGYLYGGSITDASLECITPDKEPQAEDDDSDASKIVTSSLTGEQVLAVLNDASELTDTKGLFTYFVAAGLTVEFNPWGETGERVLSCKLPNGDDIDPEASYTVAYFNGSLPITAEPEDVLDMTWQEAFLQWLDTQGGTVEKPDMTLTLNYQ